MHTSVPVYNPYFMYCIYTSDCICSFYPISAEITCSIAYVTHICAVHTLNMYVNILFIQRICMNVFCSYNRSFTTPLKSRRDACPCPYYVQLPQYNTTPLPFIIPHHASSSHQEMYSGGRIAWYANMASDEPCGIDN